MPVPTTIDQLSTTSASNYPQGTDSPSTLDDVQRAHGSFIAKLRDLVGLVTGTYVPATAIANMGLTTAALGAAPIASPTFTGTVTAPSGGYVGISSANVTGALGYTPVQQGTGTNQSTNAVKIGWGNGPYAGKVALAIDTTDMGFLWPIDTAGNASSATKLSTASGSAPSYAARAWCVFDGTLTGTNAPTAGANVTSITRLSTGQYTVNFSTAMQDANYAVQATAKRVSGNSGAQIMESELTARSSSSITLLADNQGGSFVDPTLISVSIFR